MFTLFVCFFYLALHSSAWHNCISLVVSLHLHMTNNTNLESLQTILSQNTSPTMQRLKSKCAC